MKRIGICKKCGEEKMVQDHHIHGYGEEHKDVTAPYCESCDKKAHYKARKEGKCILPSDETTRLSHNSCLRRSRKTKMISSESMMPSVRLFEQIYLNVNTGNVTIGSSFAASNGKKIKYIDI